MISRALSILAGDLLRDEAKREGSTHGELIRDIMNEGKNVPMEVTVRLVEDAMDATLRQGRPGEGWENGKGRFLLDGFPRQMDQALKFDEEV
jgi:UMP-CMP kinase